MRDFPDIVANAWSPSALWLSILLALPLVAAEFASAQETDSSAETEADDTFDVWEYRVLGNSVLAGVDVERALYGHLGPGKSIADVELARQALEQVYRTAGYSTVFVDIPEQTVDSGIVRLAVTEGRLDRVRVTGARYFSNRQILADLPALAAGEVPQLQTLQQQFADLNRQTADRSVTPILRAGRFPGTVDLELRVEDTFPFHGGLEVNNRYTADTTELRTSMNLSYDNLWQRAHTASFQYQTAPENREEAEVIAATYVARLNDVKSIVALYAVDSSSDVATVGTLSVLGSGQIFGVRGIRPLRQAGDFFHNATLGIDFKDFDENILLSAGNGLRTAIKYVNWSATYAFGWNRPKSTSELSIGASWGLRGFGNDDFEFEEKRFKARANYAYLLGSAQRTQQIFGNARFVSRLNWQYTDRPLISNEQFSAGGASGPRGYLEAERLGDYGAALSLELHTPPLLSGARIQDMRIFGFYDAASLRLEDALPGQLSRTQLESAGLGFRFLGLGGLSIDIDWAQVLKDGANVLDGEQRTHFRVSYGF